MDLSKIDEQRWLKRQCDYKELIEVSTDAQRKSMRHKERMANDPAYKERRRKQQREQKREKRASDPAYRKRVNEDMRRKRTGNPIFLEYYRAYILKRRANDPTYSKRAREKGKERYHLVRKIRLASDPAFLHRRRQSQSNWRRNKWNSDSAYRESQRKWHRERRQERYANDPAYRKKILRRNRAAYLARRHAKFFSDFQILKEKLIAHANRLAETTDDVRDDSARPVNGDERSRAPTKANRVSKPNGRRIKRSGEYRPSA